MYRAFVEATRRAELPEAEPRERIVDYPKLRTHSEQMLVRGYSGLIRHRSGPRRIALEPVERSVQPLFDQSGLVYGEPLSRGRTGLSEGD